MRVYLSDLCVPCGKKIFGPGRFGSGIYDRPLTSR